MLRFSFAQRYRRGLHLRLGPCPSSIYYALDSSPTSLRFTPHPSTSSYCEASSASSLRFTPHPSTWSYCEASSASSRDFFKLSGLACTSACSRDLKPLHTKLAAVRAFGTNGERTTRETSATHCVQYTPQLLPLSVTDNELQGTVRQPRRSPETVRGTVRNACWVEWERFGLANNLEWL